MRFLVLLGLLAGTARADYAAGMLPEPRAFSSEDGTQILKVVAIREGQDYRKSDARMFAFNRDGSEREIRRFTLINAPERVLISPDGGRYIVTLDTFTFGGRKHTVVIYDNNGKLLHELKLTDLLSLDERAEHVQDTVSSSRWRGHATFGFEIPTTQYQDEKAGRSVTFTKLHPEQMRLNITWPWGRKSIVLATGEVINHPAFNAPKGTE